jgi:hypothetical protein
MAINYMFVHVVNVHKLTQWRAVVALKSQNVGVTKVMVACKKYVCHNKKSPKE